MRWVSNLWGQPRPEGDPEPAPDVQAEVDNEAEIEAEIEAEAPPEAPPEDAPGEATPAVDLTPIEPVATRDGLPTMAQLDALSAELDEIDAALAAMDADPSLPGRATTQNA